jgi:hypothetical protein
LNVNHGLAKTTKRGYPYSDNPFWLIRIRKTITSFLGLEQELGQRPSRAPFLELAQEQQPEPVQVSFPPASRSQQRKMIRREAVLEPMQRFSSSSVSPPLFFVSFSRD